MFRYILKRLGQSIIVLLGVTLVVFVVMNLTGDPLDFILPPGTPPEVYDRYEKELGYDQPIAVQYGRFLINAVQGDFGESHYYKKPAMEVVLSRVPATLQLALTALGLSILVGIPLGVLAAIKRGTPLDASIRFVALLGQCVPIFWLGMVLMLVFSIMLRWLPTYGNGSLKHLILPAVALSAYSCASIARLVRSGMIDVLGQEYITVARAKGVRELAVIMKHAFKNSLSSVLTILGLQMASLLGGSLVTETVFSWPGLGRLLQQAVLNRDFTVVEAVVCLIACTFVLVNLLVDIFYAVINPRIKYQ
ncbi:glutathione ABC transporter permease [Oscillospiraceae bacterium]|nr:glutathione ABC transporter permease [Oscillospiraceae bacterium]BDF73583.1 glutathione ABC transporter permease [Oscillospiraceae bacterium]